MQIGLTITALERSLASGGIDGIGNYTRELMKEFDKNPTISVFPITYGYTDKYLSAENCTKIKFGKYSRLIALSSIFGTSFYGSRKIKKKVALVHATDHLIPRYRDIPVVATLHDAIPLSHPQWNDGRFCSIKNNLWKKYAGFASHIITISQYSKQEIIKYFDIEDQRISVIPNGVDERWFRSINKEVLESVLKKYRLPRHYFLFVGTLQPRKNIGTLIKAWRSLPARIRKEAPLVVIGRVGWKCKDIVETLTSPATEKSLFWLRHLPDDELFAVLKGATALVFPSLCEGFGLPVIEAFAAGTPVITSNTTSLPEVAGDAALLVNPLDVEDIANAMQLMMEEQAVANRFREKGRERALFYSWEKTASMTIDVYKNVLSMV